MSSTSNPQSEEHCKYMSTWTRNYVERYGLFYDDHTIPLSEYLKTFTERIRRCKLLDSMKGSSDMIEVLIDFTKESLTFSIPLLNVDMNSFTKKSYFIEVEQCASKFNAHVEKVRKEKKCLLDQAPGNRELFESWASKCRDFLDEILKFVVHSLPTNFNECLFLQLFMAFSRIALLTPWLGDSTKRTLTIKEKKISSIPDVRFVMNETMSSIITLTLSELKVPKFNGEVLSCKDEEFSADKINSKFLGQHAGELLGERMHSAFGSLVLGSMCIGTQIILTYMDLHLDHFERIVQHGDTESDRCVIHYTKPYDFLVEEDRNAVLEILFWLGYLQSFGYESILRGIST